MAKKQPKDDPQDQLKRLVGYQSTADLLSDFLEGSVQSERDRAVVQKIIEGREGRRLGAEEVNNPQIYTLFVSSAFEEEESLARGLYDGEKSKIIHALREDDEGKLAKMALGLLSPVEVKGDDAHNEIAKAHATFLGVSSLKEKVDAGEEVKYKEVVDAVKPIAEAMVARRLSEETNPDNKYLPDKVKKAVVAATINAIERTGVGREYLTYAVNEAAAALDARFPEGDKSVANYAEKTLNYMNEGEARKAVTKIFTSKLKKK
ncbi:MAG: hypothetical protein ABH864_03135 [archaeon]